METTINFNAATIIQIASVLLTGLFAGLLYGYDCSVIKGLGSLPDNMYLQAFQSINKAIQNPYFFISFIGSFITLPLVTWFCYKAHFTVSWYLLLAATVIFIIGVFAITAFGNIPLNNMLDKFDISAATPEALQQMRRKFESSWNTLHHIRTYASIFSFLLATLSLFKTT